MSDDQQTPATLKAPSLWRRFLGRIMRRHPKLLIDDPDPTFDYDRYFSMGTREYAAGFRPTAEQIEKKRQHHDP